MHPPGVAVLLARFDNFKTATPGGCIIGARPLDTHFDVFLQMGVGIKHSGKFYNFAKIGKSEKTQEIILDEFSVTATENVLLFAAGLNKKTILKIADQDYQVQEVAKVLKKMGAKIKIAGPHIFEIKGSEKLKACHILEYSRTCNPYLGFWQRRQKAEP